MQGAGSGGRERAHMQEDTYERFNTILRGVYDLWWNDEYLPPFVSRAKKYAFVDFGAPPGTKNHWNANDDRRTTLLTGKLQDTLPLMTQKGDMPGSKSLDP